MRSSSSGKSFLDAVGRVSVITGDCFVGRQVPSARCRKASGALKVRGGGVTEIVRT